MDWLPCPAAASLRGHLVFRSHPGASGSAIWTVFASQGSVCSDRQILAPHTLSLTLNSKRQEVSVKVTLAGFHALPGFREMLTCPCAFQSLGAEVVSN